MYTKAVYCTSIHKASLQRKQMIGTVHGWNISYNGMEIETEKPIEGYK